MRRHQKKDRGTLGRIPATVSPAGSPPMSAPLSPPWPPLPAAFYGGPSAKRGAGVGAFLLAIVTAGALAHVGVRIKGLQVAYDLGSERRITTDLEEQRRRLQIEIGMLKDPGRVISIARDKLQMGPPASEAIWRLGSEAAPRSGGPAPTTPAQARATTTTTKATTKTTSKTTGPGPRGMPTRKGTAGAKRGRAAPTARGAR